MHYARWMALTAVGFMAGACTTERHAVDTTAPADMAATKDPVVKGHAVYDERLRDLMAGLQAATNENWPEDMDDEHAAVAAPKTRLAFDKAIPLGEALAQSAQQIPDTVAHLVMVEADRRAFRAQSETLRDHARALTAAARGRNADEVRAVLRGIDSTCRACHARFLDISGPLSPL